MCLPAVLNAKHTGRLNLCCWCQGARCASPTCGVEIKDNDIGLYDTLRCRGQARCVPTGTYDAEA